MGYGKIHVLSSCTNCIAEWLVSFLGLLISWSTLDPSKLCSARTVPMSYSTFTSVPVLLFLFFCSCSFVPVLLFMFFCSCFSIPFFCIVLTFLLRLLFLLLFTLFSSSPNSYLCSSTISRSQSPMSWFVFQDEFQFLYLVIALTLCKGPRSCQLPPQSHQFLEACIFLPRYVAPPLLSHCLVSNKWQ